MISATSNLFTTSQLWILITRITITPTQCCTRLSWGSLGRTGSSPLRSSVRILRETFQGWFPLSFKERNSCCSACRNEFVCTRSVLMTGRSWFIRMTRKEWLARLSIEMRRFMWRLVCIRTRCSRFVIMKSREFVSGLCVLIMCRSTRIWVILWNRMSILCQIRRDI